MNIYTVKWGTKYNASHVNQLYESCLENLTIDFTFHCLTEDSKDINSDIKILSLPGGNKLEKWWNKMYLFDETIVTQRGEKMFFDLDTILQKNIDDIANFDPEDCLCFVKTWWHDLETQYKDTRHIPHKYTDLNSSVLRWNDSLNSNEITEYFNQYKSQILWYYRGLDNFFYNRRIVKTKLFPIGWVYSFNQGFIHPHDTESHVYRDLPYVCIFDSMGKSEDVKF
tara:strand:+ start:46500 stop:47174 length:675 start_codon:yes stop_codon:yes gene_type:complete